MPSNMFLSAAAADRDGSEESLKQPGQSHFFLGLKENSCQSVPKRELAGPLTWSRPWVGLYELWELRAGLGQRGWHPQLWLAHSRMGVKENSQRWQVVGIGKGSTRVCNTYRT